MTSEIKLDPFVGRNARPEDQVAFDRIEKAFKQNHDKSKLSPKEMTNIILSYEQYGERHLTNFIQAIWQEAFQLGLEEGKSGGH